MDRRGLIPIVLFVLAFALLAAAVASGGASFFLLLILPGLVGSSPLFAGGILCLILAFLTIPLAYSPSVEGPRTYPTSGPSPATPDSSGAAGVVLIGPLPIFFGRWRGVRGRAHWLAVLAGLVLVAVAVLLFVLP